MLEEFKGFHLEATNICTLKCPRCSRTQFIEQFPAAWKNHNVNLDHLKTFIDVDLTDKIVDLRGTYGDPIYYNRLLELVQWLKESGAYIQLSTNGSYYSEDNWRELSNLLDHKDLVIFAIDGVPDNFTKYRVNADWPSIEQGIKIVTTSRAKTRWEYLPFSFNTDTIDQARQLSAELGITEFVIKPSDRWDDGDDWLRPSDTKLINPVKFMSLKRPDTEINPRCFIRHWDHYISAEGFYTPCCFIADHRYYYKSQFYKHRDLYDISKTTLTEVLNNPLTEEFYSSIVVNKLPVCMYNCPKL
jgi:MoaA/NifB/PqqE/SkfB family radical SAM enzyme